MTIPPPQKKGRKNTLQETILKLDKNDKGIGFADDVHQIDYNIKAKEINADVIECF